MRERPDRAAIEMAWIQRVIEHRVKETVQRGGPAFDAGRPFRKRVAKPRGLYY